MKQKANFIITGRIGKIDAKEKVTHIDVATNYPYKDKDDNWKDRTVWNRVTLFKNQHERATEIGVGDLVTFAGRVGQSSYELNGVRHYNVDLTVADFTIERRKGEQAPPTNDTPLADDEGDDDIPF